MRIHPTLVGSALALALVLPARSSRAGDVSGRLTIDPAPPPFSSATPSAPKAAPPLATSEPAPAPSALVYVESIEPPPDGFPWPADLEAPRVEMRALAFRPREAVVRAGGTVAFENGDDLFHQPFSCSRGNRFDLGRYRKGEAPAVTFPEAGVARVYCDVHSGMRAFVLVLQNPYYSRVAPDGTFRITNVPPGRHRLAIVFEGDVLARREVEVSESGDVPAIDWRVASAPRAKDEDRTAAIPAPCCCAEGPAAAR